MKDRLGQYLLKKRIEVVMPHIVGKLVDIGCGSNSLVKTYGHNSVGVDTYPWEGVDLLVPDTSKLPFESASIDTVSIIAALNHIPNRQDVLQEAHRILKANGRILITMIPPLLSTVWHTLRRPWDADQSERGMIEGETYGISPGQVRKLLAGSGFVISREIPFMFGVNRLYIAEKGQ